MAFDTISTFARYGLKWTLLWQIDKAGSVLLPRDLIPDIKMEQNCAENEVITCDYFC